MRSAGLGFVPIHTDTLPSDLRQGSIAEKVLREQEVLVGTGRAETSVPGPSRGKHGWQAQAVATPQRMPPSSWQGLGGPGGHEDSRGAQRNTMNSDKQCFSPGPAPAGITHAEAG